MEETCMLSGLAEADNDRMSLSNISKCSIGIYPFFDGKLEDFEPVFNELINVCPLY